MIERRSQARVSGFTIREKRKFTRVLSQGESSVFINFPDTGSSEFMDVHDISIGGARIPAPKNLEICEELPILVGIIKLPDEKSFVIRTELKNISNDSDGNRYLGLSFRNILNNEMRLIEKYVAATLKRQIAS